ncbi:hypothetical protein NDU88_003591 [Pleurodeles waltl]|uniref:Uncharacterized protein n=1 Tax=Pleurodeles waltl TaxID=8319 RepID=A0AAV7SGD3_PLEWA|nr:hypothetical protein NDU88_003591 [Pleurodeles waltl]
MQSHVPIESLWHAWQRNNNNKDNHNNNNDNNNNTNNILILRVSVTGRSAPRFQTTPLSRRESAPGVPARESSTRKCFPTQTSGLRTPGALQVGEGRDSRLEGQKERGAEGRKERGTGGRKERGAEGRKEQRAGSRKERGVEGQKDRVVQGWKERGVGGRREWRVGGATGKPTSSRKKRNRPEDAHRDLRETRSTPPHPWRGVANTGRIVPPGTSTT